MISEVRKNKVSYAPLPEKYEAGTMPTAEVVAFNESIKFMESIGIENIMKHAKKNNIVAGIHNKTPEYATKMIEMGFQLVTVGSDQRYMSSGAKSVVEKLKKLKVR